MGKARKEIEAIEKIEEERQFRNVVEKMSVVGLTKKMKKLVNQMDDVKVNEKQMLMNVVSQIKQGFAERQKRLTQEITLLKHEKNSMFVRLTTLDTTDGDYKEKIDEIVEELKTGNGERSLAVT